ncbi:GNAT family N-acetyltransferase [Lacticaseibacillus absianus]|uniref:GNAT family N-acetyltransferase n=1 Tax=Lacticaseibacillus absianus TaxID=2729623 RepID=UPI0015CE0FE6|nr:GNAT family N-acetyltransferase [Lacticaseibacillus absianus]
MTTSFRPCTPADIDQLRTLSVETFTDAFGAQNTPADLQDYLAHAYAPEALRRELTTPNSTFYFAFVGCTLAGYAKLNTDDAQSEQMGPDYLEVERLYIRRDFQHQGLGRQLLTLAAARAEALGKHYLWLGVWALNTDAQAFYTAAGFHTIGQHPFTLGTSVQVDLMLEKHLG